MISLMVVMWGMPVITLPVMVMVSGFFIGIMAPEYVFGFFSIINAIFAYIFELIHWLYPVEQVLVDKNGYEEVFHQVPGPIYQSLQGFFTGLPERGKDAVAESIILIGVLEILAFTVLMFGAGADKDLNHDTSAFSAENTDSSWIFGKSNRRK